MELVTPSDPDANSGEAVDVHARDVHAQCALGMYGSSATRLRTIELQIVQSCILDQTSDVQ
jgi:hypothetical protein|eukprot:5454924-Prymnesium_polylepis.1